MVKQLVQIFTSFHFRNLILNAMIPEKVIPLQGMVEHNVYEYFLEHDSLEIKQAKPSSKPAAAKRLCHHRNAKQPQPWTHDQRGSQLRGSLTIKLCNCSRWFFPSMYRDINRC